MISTSLHQLETALHEAAKHLMRAAGQDERLSPREFRQKITTLSGEMRDLVEALYQFVIDIDKQGANHITERDIENAVAQIKAEIFPHYVVAESVLDENGQKSVKALAPKTALNLAFQLYQTARENQLIPPAHLFQMIKSLSEGLFFDHLGSESAEPIEAVHINCNLTSLNQEFFAQALGLEPNKPEEAIERYRDAAFLLPIFVRQHLDAGLEEQAQAMVELMQVHLRQIVVAVLGEDSSEVGPQHPVYVLGLASDGSLLGFRSKVIWT